MKKLKFLLSAFALSLACSVSAQDDSNSFFSEDGNLNDSIATDLPTGAPIEGLEPIEMLNPRADDIYWSKVVYKIIDLREKFNYPFYFPTMSSDNRKNLFTLIFGLAQSGKIKLYSYEEQKEVFDNQHTLPIKDIITNTTYDFQYVPKLDSITKDTIYEVAETDIPCYNVLKYYMKEVWFFDKVSSTFNCRIIGLCPILTVNGDTGLETYPLFWVSFEKLRPFLAQQEILLTDKNNGARPSFDDVFMKRRFNAYIYRESNVQDNRMLVEYCMDTESVHKEQARIKTNIINFENDLWEY